MSYDLAHELKIAKELWNDGVWMHVVFVVNREFSHFSKALVIWRFLLDGFKFSKETTVAWDLHPARSVGCTLYSWLWWFLQSCFFWVYRRPLIRLMTRFCYNVCRKFWNRRNRAWMVSLYSSDRTQYVYHGSLRSSVVHLVCGVLQGSVLGPILFIFYVVDLTALIEKHGMMWLTTHQYANDTQIYMMPAYHQMLAFFVEIFWLCRQHQHLNAA